MHAVLSGLKQALSRRGHTVLIVSRMHPGLSRLQMRDAPDEDIHRIGSAGSSRLLDFLLIPLQLHKLLRRRRIDVVHLHFSGWFRPWILFLLPFALFYPIRFVTTFQDYEHPELPRNTFWRKMALGLLLRRSAAITAVSDFLKNRISAAFPGIAGEVQTVYNGVESCDRALT